MLAPPAVQAEKRLHARPTGGLRRQFATRLAVHEVRERRRLGARREAGERDPRRPFDHPVVARRDRVAAGLRDGRDGGLELEPTGQHEQPDAPGQELGNRPSRQSDRQRAPHAAGVVQSVRLHPGALPDQALAVDDPDRHRPARLELALGLVVSAARGEKRHEGEEAEARAHAGESTDRGSARAAAARSSARSFAAELPLKLDSGRAAIVARKASSRAPREDTSCRSRTDSAGSACCAAPVW